MIRLIVTHVFITRTIGINYRCSNCNGKDKCYLNDCLQQGDVQIIALSQKHSIDLKNQGVKANNGESTI